MPLDEDGNCPYCSTKNHEARTVCEQCAKKYETSCSECHLEADVDESGLCTDCMITKAWSTVRAKKGICRDCTKVRMLGNNRICRSCFAHRRVIHGEINKCGGCKILIPINKTYCNTCDLLTIECAHPNCSETFIPHDGNIYCSLHNGICEGCGSRSDTSMCKTCTTNIIEGRCVKCLRNRKLNNEGRCVECCY